MPYITRNGHREYISQADYNRLQHRRRASGCGCGGTCTCRSGYDDYDSNAGDLSIGTDGDLAIGIGGGLTMEADGDIGMQVGGVSLEFGDDNSPDFGGFDFGGSDNNDSFGGSDFGGGDF